MKFVYILATLDTKGAEADFVRSLLTERGLATKLVDTGCLGEPAVRADIDRQAVYRAAGAALDQIQQKRDRGTGVELAAEGARKVVLEAHAAGQVAGVLALGGSAGTTIGTNAMRALPIGIPKVMVSTLASGQVRHFVGDKDIFMLNSVVDILGLNRISRRILAEAAAAMAGMVNYHKEHVASDKPLIAATMFGVTTKCVERAREILSAAGYEVLVFHATGNGGLAMESLIRDGLIEGVLDITTTELADEIAGGFLSAGPTRLTAAAETGVPQVVSVGATDMVNFFGIDTVPEKYRNRKLYKHNAHATLMRTTPEENDAIGREIGEKVGRSKGPARILLPLRGVSAIDAKGQPFDDEEARRRLFAAVRAHGKNVPVEMRAEHINDPPFAEAAAQALLQLIQQKATP